MSRPLAAALLAHPDITALIGDRCALMELPASTVLPALVYTIPDIQPGQYLGEDDNYEVMRIQINPLAYTIAEVQQIHDAVRNALDGMFDKSIAGHRIIHIRRGVAGPEDNATDGAGHTVWSWPRDYIVTFEPLE
jgi:hypothetical protein